MKIKFTDKLNNSEANIVMVLDDKLAFPTYANEIKNELGIDLAKVIKMHGYKPDQSKSLFIPTDSKNIKSILLFGVGDIKKLNQSKLINCGSSLYKKLKHYLLQGADIHFSEALLNDNEKLFPALKGPPIKSRGSLPINLISPGASNAICITFFLSASDICAPPGESAKR